MQFHKQNVIFLVSLRSFFLNQESTGFILFLSYFQHYLHFCRVLSLKKATPLQPDPTQINLSGGWVGLRQVSVQPQSCMGCIRIENYIAFLGQGSPLTCPNLPHYALLPVSCLSDKSPTSFTDVAKLLPGIIILYISAVTQWLLIKLHVFHSMLFASYLDSFNGSACHFPINWIMA